MTWDDVAANVRKMGISIQAGAAQATVPDGGMQRIREVLNDGKHIIADMLQGVTYTPEELQRWVNEAEAALFATPEPDSEGGETD
jgi:hypothetical protein